MFFPQRRNGKLYKLKDADGYGERNYSKHFKQFGWGYSYDRDNLAHSSIRVDSSATKARAGEYDFDTRICMTKDMRPRPDDKVTIGDKRVFKISRVQERLDVAGHLHHWEIDLVQL